MEESSCWVTTEDTRQVVLGHRRGRGAKARHATAPLASVGKKTQESQVLLVCLFSTLEG